jgi:hypothetical protein
MTERKPARKDGQIFVIMEDHTVHTYDLGSDNTYSWLNLHPFGAHTEKKLVDIAVMPDGTLLGLGADPDAPSLKYLYQAPGLKDLYIVHSFYADWESVRPADSNFITAIACTNAGMILGVSTTYAFQIRNSLMSEWQLPTPDNGLTAESIDIMPDGKIIKLEPMIRVNFC